MATKKRSGLGRGIGALIPQSTGERPVDVFFPTRSPEDESHGESSGGVPVPRREDGAEPFGAADASDQSDLREVPGARLTRLALSDIVPNRSQPRTEFDEEALEELTHSVREFGVFQPIVVREISPAPAVGEPRYELIMGERRFREWVADKEPQHLAKVPDFLRRLTEERRQRWPANVLATDVEEGLIAEFRAYRRGEWDRDEPAGVPYVPAKRAR